MNRKTFFSVTFVLTFVGVSLLGSGRQADACYLCGGYWGRPVLWAGCVLRHAFHPYYYAPYYSYGPYYSYAPYYSCHGCYYGGGCYGWSNCCDCVSCCDSWTSYHSVIGAPPSSGQPTPAPPQPQPQEASPDAPPAGETTMKRGALLNVTAPSDAKVFVNGRATISTGPSRRYIARDLQPGLAYTFELRAELTRDGQTVSETKTVALQANQTADVSFGFRDQQRHVAARPVRTSLAVHVPADARVWLEGNTTRGTGTVRQFATSRLTAGQTWNDYEIRVEVERDGQVTAQRKKITLSAGQSHEVRFDFDSPQVVDSPKDKPKLEVRPVAGQL